MRLHICSLCHKLALKHRHRAERFQLAAVVAKGHRVFSMGINNSKGIGSFRSSVHAEEAAVKRAPQLVGGDIYVCRILDNGSLALAKPCEECLEIIQDKGIDTVYYTGKDGCWTEMPIRS